MLFWRIRAGEKRRAGLEARLRRFGRSERGVTAVEFALVLPVLLMLFVGMVEFTEAFSITRKLSNSVSTVADLVSREPSVSTAELTDIVTVADQLMQPYATAPMDLVIVSVVTDADNTPTVAWSHPAGEYVPGVVYDLPEEALTAPNSSIIVTEGRYDFTPTVTQFLGSFEITQRSFFRPRMGPAVQKID